MSEPTKDYQTFTAETELGPMQVSASFWQEGPNGYPEPTFTLEYRFGTPYREADAVAPRITISRIEYSACISVKWYIASDKQWHMSAGLHTTITRHDQTGNEPTDNARAVIQTAVWNDAKSRNILPLLETAKQTHAQYMANREIEKAREHLKRAAQWSPMMATGDARHYERGFTITSKHTDADDI